MVHFGGGQTNTVLDSYKCPDVIWTIDLRHLINFGLVQNETLAVLNILCTSTVCMC